MIFKNTTKLKFWQRLAISVVVFSCMLPDVLKAQSTDTLRVLTYNVNFHAGTWPDDLPALVDLINEKDPHVVALRGIAVNTTDYPDFMPDLEEGTGMNGVVQELFEWHEGYYANGLLTSLPIISSGDLLYEQPEGGQQRGLVHAVVQYNERGLGLMSSLFDPGEEANREAMVNQLYEVASEDYAEMPIILGAGIYDAEGSSVHEAMDAAFTDVWLEVGEGDGFNYPNDEPDQRPDYLFYHSDENYDLHVTPLSAEVIQSDISAWLPVFSEFEIVDNTATSNEDHNTAPTSFELQQNYPNPFNPTTKINYSLSSSGEVKLEVFDITGRLVSTLINQTQSAGSHTINFDASALPSGMYIYQLKAEGVTQTRKMTLIK